MRLDTAGPRQEGSPGHRYPGRGAGWVLREFVYLSEALDKLILLGSQAGGVAVAHRQVHLTTVTPERGGVGWHPGREQPVTPQRDAVGRVRVGEWRVAGTRAQLRTGLWGSQRGNVPRRPSGAG